MTHADYDLIIAGSGLAGNCLALALHETGMRIAIVEAHSRTQRRDSALGDRALALAKGTVRLLEALNVWQGVAHLATPIEHIHVSDQGHFGKTRLSARQERIDALGYVIVARDLEEHVADLAAQTSVKPFCPARIVGLMPGKQQISVALDHGSVKSDFTAHLIVGADGGQSSVRRLLHIGRKNTDYGQSALVTTVSTELPNNSIAFERFTASGPLALLPLGKHRCAVVWSRRPEDAAALLAMSEAEFITQLQRCFGYKLGALQLAAPRHAFPLTLVQADQMVAGRAVLIGNAAHQLHPVAGQGFNLGLRDVAQLAEILQQRYVQSQDIGAADFLADYAAIRQHDHNRVIGFTNSLVQLFSNTNAPVAAARNAGLTLLDQIPAAKSRLTRYAMGLAGGLPRIGARR
ncbi:MAG: 2-octaprenyl-6-methoxyphenyl hydroxylase [Gammaproteobacteria bacterium]